jgi:class 3 adenylate cyclase/DNA-binding SARP family transcriptional activator
MEFRMLGPLEVRLEGRLLRLGGSKQRALLAALLLNANEVMSTERLVEALWGSEPPEAATKTLQVHVSQLRKAIPGLGLHSRRPGYVLEVGPGQLDLDQFELLVSRGREALTTGDPLTAARTLREALALWRGPALSELSATPFTLAEQTRLQELRLAAIEDRVEADLALGRHGTLVGELEALIAANPLRERLRGQLMLTLYRSGRQAEALAAYQDLRRALVDELGIEPTPPLQRLERAILNQDPALDLPAPAAPPPPILPVPASRETPAPRDERKVVTVLFADLVGSTELAGSQDPERTRAVLDRFYEAMAAEIERAGGTIEKFAGDAVMAAFGAPAAYEDHAERALHAALAMRRRLEELFGNALSLRIGVNSGEVVVGRPRKGSSFVTGDPVNVAARLEQAAEPGEILVGERTASIARGAFEFAEPATLQAKGKPAGVSVRGLVRAVSRQRPRGVGGLRRAFVGRGRELEMLEATYRRVVDRGEPHLVTIIGEAGVGKTRLVGELWESLGAESPEPVRRTGRCLPYGRGITYWPLGEILKEELGLLESDPPETVRARLGAREILGLALGLDVAGGLHPLAARERLHAAWIELLEGLTAERPAVILIEDLHWGEEPLLDLLDRLVRDVRAPVLFLATARPELLAVRPGWGGARRAASTLELEPLSLESAERLLCELLAADLPPHLRNIGAHAEGNPFFVEEVVGALIDQGVLERANGGWKVHQMPADFALPDSVQAVLAARIDLLGRPEKAALQAASVIGRVFWAGPIYELLDEEDLDFGVLEDRDFIRRRHRSSIAGETEFMFKHQLTREVAYASLPKAQRARLHAGFAAWLERFGEGRDEHAPLLAHHYAEAVRREDADLAWAGAEEEAERLRSRATAWLRRAAELAARRYAIDDEIALLERAVGLEASEGARAELWRSIARANAVAFDREGFWTAMLEAAECSRDPQARADLFSELAFQTVYRWRHAEDKTLVEDWIGRALELAQAGSSAEARALLARSYSGHPDGKEAAERASAIVERLPDPELRAYAFHARADRALLAGDYEEAIGWAERRLQVLADLGDPDQLADAYWSALTPYLGLARFDDARRIAALHDDLTRDLTPHHRLHGVAVLLEVEELAGDWEAVQRISPRAERAASENTTPCVHSPRSLLACALAHAYLGNEEESRRLQMLAASLGVEEYGRTFEVRVRLALHRGDLVRVGELLAEAEQPRKTLLRSIKLAPVAARLDVLAAVGRREDIEAEAPALARPGTYLEPFALRALGVARDDDRLLEQADARFAALGLDSYAERPPTPIRGS